MTLRARLALGILAIGLLLVAPLFVSLESITALGRRVQSLRDNEFAASLFLTRLRAGTAELRDAEFSMVYLRDSLPSPANRDRVIEALNGMEALTDSLQASGP